MWLFITLLSYFCFAVNGVIDKFLLSKTSFHPGVYAFLISVLGLLGFLLVPFGATAPADHWPLMLAAGGIFIYALFFFFAALKVLEASRTLPLTGTLVALFSLAIAIFYFGEHFNTNQSAAFTLLVVGGILISFESDRRLDDQTWGWFFAVAAAICYAIGFYALKLTYASVGFLPGFVWTRVGGLAAGLTLLAIPEVRRGIIAMFSTPAKQNANLPPRLGLVFAGQGIGAVGSFLQNYAIALGSVALINALQGTQYVFLFLMTTALSFRFPQILNEKQNTGILVQKIVAIAIIAIGLFLII